MATYTDRALITQAEVARFGSMPFATANQETPGAAVQQRDQRRILLELAAESAAATAILAGLMWTDRAIQIISLTLVPLVAVAASDTNYKTLALAYNNGAGGGNTTIFSATTQTTGQAAGLGSLVAQTVINASGPTFTVGGGGNPWTVANMAVPASKLLVFTGTATGTGVVVGPFACDIVYQEV